MEIDPWTNLTRVLVYDSDDDTVGRMEYSHAYR